MTFRTLILLLLAQFSITTEAFTQVKSEPPNVVFIICDDLNDALGSLGGHPQALTPNLDSLAKNGVSFTNMYTNAPICGPSRASLWSGLYPHTTGYYGYNQQENHWRNNPTLKNSVTVFEHLADNGYQVYGTGKIHHNGHEDWSIFYNADGSSGFSVNPNFGPYPWNGNSGNKDQVFAHPDLPADYQSTVTNVYGNFGAVRDLSDAFEGNGGWVYKVESNADVFHYNSEEDRDLMPDELCVEYTKEVLNQSHDKPFFMAVGFNRPHSPNMVPEKYFDMFPLDQLELAPYLLNDLDDCAAALRNGDFNSSGFYKYTTLLNSSDEDLMLKWTQAYLACVAFVDDQIGQVVEAIEKSPYADNTIIVVTSDHGYHMGEKEYVFKNTLWEESTRIPLIIAGLDAPKNKICNKPVSLIDMYPTIVDYCGLPDNPNSETNKLPLDGHSIRPLVLDPENGQWDGSDFALIAVASNFELEKDEPGPAIEQHFSIRTEQYRYILCRDEEEELYDHQSDQYEWTNLANNSDYAALKDELRTKLLDAIKPSPDQVIIFESIGDHQPGDSPFEIFAKASSRLEVTFSIESGPATIAGNVITLTGETGTVVVRATQEGDDYFNEASEVLSFEVKELLNLVLNGDFEDGVEHWRNWANNGAAAQYSAPSEGSAHGEKHLKIEVETIGTNNWDVQSLSTPFDVDMEHNYSLSFMAKADQSRTIKSVVQEGSYIAKNFTLSDEWNTYSWEFKPAEATKSVRFNYLEVGTYFLDNVEVIDLDAVDEQDTTSAVNNIFDARQIVYPNPFSNIINLNSTQLPVSVKMYDVMGKTVYDAKDKNGIQTISGFDQLIPGIYFLSLITKNRQQTVKILKE